MVSRSHVVVSFEKDQSLLPLPGSDCPQGCWLPSSLWVHASNKDETTQIIEISTKGNGTHRHEPPVGLPNARIGPPERYLEEWEE